MLLLKNLSVIKYNASFWEVQKHYFHDLFFKKNCWDNQLLTITLNYYKLWQITWLSDPGTVSDERPDWTLMNINSPLEEPEAITVSL